MEVKHILNATKTGTQTNQFKKILFSIKANINKAADLFNHEKDNK